MKLLHKIIAVAALVTGITFSANAQQIKSVYIKASGLTCSMCSKAIYKSLEKVSAVANVEADIENSGYLVTFKSDALISLDALKDAVVDAGFSVAAMEVKANFNKVAVENDAHIKFSNSTFHFIKVPDTTLQGDQNLLVLDKEFLPEDDRKKYAAATAMACFETGRMKKTSGVQERIYHVTMQ